MNCRYVPPLPARPLRPNLYPCLSRACMTVISKSDLPQAMINITYFQLLFFTFPRALLIRIILRFYFLLLRVLQEGLSSPRQTRLIDLHQCDVALYPCRSYSAQSLSSGGLLSSPCYKDLTAAALGRAERSCYVELLWWDAPALPAFPTLHLV